LVGKNKLPRSLSLRRRAEIDSLFEHGRRIPTDFFTLIWQPAEEFKFGIFVSRQAGKAVQRNRIRRRFREAVRLNRHRLTNPVALVLMPRVGGPEPEFERLVDDVGRIFEKLNREN